MSLRSKAWIVAATVGAVEAMKDQGFARWNYTIRSLHQHANSNFRSCDLAKKISFPAANISNRATQDKAKRAEESWRKVLYLSCWGPN
uniref:Wound-responsive family protein n=1 Tax=Kalanchoe fedtschenkoi TaxID=63787 RepID=A0A7N0UVJ1_KALFE